VAARQRAILVGDNAFLGISHLSQERARSRGDETARAEGQLETLVTGLQHGANGFFFTVAEAPLSLIRMSASQRDCPSYGLYAIMPYAYEYIRLAVTLGGIPGLAKHVGIRLLKTRDWRAITRGGRGVVMNDPASLCAAYVRYEVGRVRDAMGRNTRLEAVLLHQVVADLALGLNMEWLFRAFIDAAHGEGLRAGFNTGALPLLVEKFHKWNLPLDQIVLAAPFNAIGFQMSPSKAACEEALARTPEAEVIAYSILASGYLEPDAAVDYLKTLSNVDGVAVGASRPQQAAEIFALLSRSLA
jgi:hypothetical protein